MAADGIHMRMEERGKGGGMDSREVEGRGRRDGLGGGGTEGRGGYSWNMGKGD
jgi:hypothetical protein